MNFRFPITAPARLALAGVFLSLDLFCSAQGVRVSFLRDESTLQETLDMFDRANISATARSNFTAMVHAYNAGPLFFYYKSPLTNGFYDFESIREATASPFFYHYESRAPDKLPDLGSEKFWETPDPAGADCFSTINILTEGRRKNLYCTLLAVKKNGAPVHEALVFKAVSIYTLIEKKGMRGPFVRLDAQAPSDLVLWLRNGIDQTELATNRFTIAFSSLK